MPLSLEGIKILDLSRHVPGLYCTMILADLGAEVIRIEAPIKDAYPPSIAVTLQQSASEAVERRAAFNPFNRNKKSIGLNFRSTEAKEIFYKMAQQSDVILEGFRPGAVEHLEVDYQTVSRFNPQIIYCSLSGYGQDGPYRDLPGHDINYISFGGALGLIGQRDGPPAIPLNLIGDFAGGTFQAVIGILTALIGREKTGVGQYIDIAMLDGIVSLMSFITFDYLCDGTAPRRGDYLLNGGYPFYNVYQAKDGEYISLGCLESHFWENLCRALGREDLIPHQYAEEKKEEIFAFLRQVFLTKTRDEWFEELKDKNIPIGKVYSVGEVFTDPQVVYRRMVEEVDHPKFGKVKQVAPHIKLSATPGKIRNTASSLGQHTDEILTSLGYNKEQIERMRVAGVIM